MRAILLLLLSLVSLCVQGVADTDPLIRAVVRKQPAVVAELLRNGADVNVRHPAYYNATALMLAVNNRDEAMVAQLLDAGADVNLQDKAGDTALNWATFHGDAAIAERLLARGIDASLSGHGNALEVALRRGHQGLVERYTDYLHRRRTLTAADAAFFSAVAAGDVRAMRASLRKGARVAAHDATDRGALGLAARRGDVAMIEALLDAGAAIDDTDPIGFTPLMEAARDGHAPAAARLLERGADVAHRAHGNGLELTALHLAAAAGEPGTVRLLVARGAPIDARDSERATPLLWATHQQPSVAVLLVELGADADLAPLDGASPRGIATERKMEALLAALAQRSVAP